MNIKKLSVYNFRTHQDFSIELNPRTTVITGKNGSGKTSLAEAIYIGLRGLSFKGSDDDIVKTGEQWYRIELWHDESKRTVTYSKEQTAAKKKFSIDDKTYYRLSLAKKYPIVIFEPDNLQLLSGSPNRRRQFIDRIIMNLDPAYARLLSRYDRALRQRNILLKQSVNHGETLFAWNVALSGYAESIIQHRQEVIDMLNRRLTRVYQKISGTKDNVTISYSFHPPSRPREYILRQLEQSLERDKVLGYTSVGPHRDDILFTFNGEDARQVASRGEVRSIVLAIKFIEVEIIEEKLKVKPVMILDDVYSELDDKRKKYVTEYMKDGQVIITGITDPTIGSRSDIAIITL